MRAAMSAGRIDGTRLPARGPPSRIGFRSSDVNLYGVESIAIDPSNTNNVYIACGKDFRGSSPHAVYKSTDQGSTWSGPYLTTVPMAANDSISGGRAPAHFCAMRANGWWSIRTRAAFFISGRDRMGFGKAPTRGSPGHRSPFPRLGKPATGVSFVAFDKTSSSSGTACTRIYIGVFGATSGGTDGGVYKSSDGGLTWTLLTNPSSGNVNQARRGQVSTVDGTLWVTHEAGVAKAGSSATALTDITPSQATKVCYNGLSFDPANASKAVIARGEVTANAPIYSTSNAGSTWTQVSAGTHTSSVPWWSSSMWAAWISSVAICPTNSSQLWYGDWYGVWMTQNYTAGTPTWNNFEKGHEELVMFNLSAPPSPAGADLLSGAADVEGFRHTNVNTFPPFSYGNAPGNGSGCNFQATFGLDYCESNPNFVVRASGSESGGTMGVCSSVNNGASWTLCSGWSSATEPRRVAVSCTTTGTFVVLVSSGKPLRTGDGGATFTACAGIAENGPAGPWETAQPLAADKVNGSDFYYYISGKLYRSTDGGQNFTAANTTLASDNSHPNLKAMPGVQGELWLSLEGSGLWHSTDSGTTFTEVKSPLNARMNIGSLSFGKQASGSVPWIYTYGTIDGTVGVHLSKDRGATWVTISLANLPMGCGPNMIEGSRQIVGRVYIGSSGRGVFQGNGQAPAIPGGLSAAASGSQIALTWSSAANAVSYNVKRSTTSGGPYTTITNVTSTSYTDTGLSHGTTYYYVVSAVNDYGESANSSQKSAITAPPTPTGLAGVPGNAQVALTWSSATGAATYNVKRSTTSGGPYTTITSPSSTSYTDTGVTNGVTYYYVVSAVNTGGESANSSQVSATPLSPLPPPFTGQDVGPVGLAGSSSYSSGTFTLKGAGTNIYSTSDAFYFVSQSWTGDVVMVTRVVSVQNTDPNAKAGLMIRESMASNSTHGTTDLTPVNGVEFLRRYTTGGSTTNTVDSGISAPYWAQVDSLAEYCLGLSITRWGHLDTRRKRYGQHGRGGQRGARRQFAQQQRALHRRLRQLHGQRSLGQHRRWRGGGGGQCQHRRHHRYFHRAGIG